MEVTDKIKLSEEEVRTILNVMSLVHPSDKAISSVHMIRIISVVMQRWYKVKVGWTSGYMNRDISYIFVDDHQISYSAILEYLEEEEYITCGRIPQGRITTRGYSLGLNSLNFLKQTQQ